MKRAFELNWTYSLFLPPIFDVFSMNICEARVVPFHMALRYRLLSRSTAPVLLLNVI